MNLVQKTMGEKGIDLWITFTREGNPDPVAADLGLAGVVWRSAAIIDASGDHVAVVGNLDAEAVRQKGIYSRVFGYGKEGASAKIGEIVARRNPKKIALNFSDDYGAADGLSPGMARYLRKSLGKRARKKFIVSSEDLVIALRAQLIPEEIELLKTSVKECERIFEVAEQDFIRVGRTDRQIHEMMKNEVEKRELELAWEESSCPIVTIANNPSGHLGYSNETLEKNQLLRIDFGVRYKAYCSDLQRVYFVGSSSPPPSVRRMFEASKTATKAGIEGLRQGTKGYVTDGICRKSVTSSGYPEYPHGTGHPLGRETHEIGPRLCPRWRERYGRSMEKKMREGMVFTIEPSVQGREGICNIEQDVLLTESGAKLLSTMEDDLYRL
ncbi:MAG TPA: M24 family metallopeptidase [Nitrososphaerales archaeon]|nr:M24 family metallopeptidase [Nitrososphaerales archaeon]